METGLCLGLDYEVAWGWGSGTELGIHAGEKLWRGGYTRPGEVVHDLAAVRGGQARLGHGCLVWTRDRSGRTQRWWCCGRVEPQEHEVRKPRAWPAGGVLVHLD